MFRHYSCSLTALNYVPTTQIDKGLRITLEDFLAQSFADTLVASGHDYHPQTH